jgi:hypothetical protein
VRIFFFYVGTTRKICLSSDGLFSYSSLVQRLSDWTTGFIDTLYTAPGTTRNYSTITDLHHLQFTAANTSVLSLLDSPIVVSWQRIHNRQLRLQLPTPELDSILIPQSESHYNWRFTANQFVLAPSPLRLTVRFFYLTLAVIILT